jgi:hypothetical protein
MVIPLAARWVAAACGVLLILTGWQSVIGTLIVPRPVASWLTRSVDGLVVAVYQSVTARVTDYVRRDRILATQAAATLVAQLGAWLAIFLAGFTLALWPSHGRDITVALADAGSSLFTLGFAEPPGTTPAVIVFIAAATGMVVVALQVGYLPTLYSAFNRRETEVALLMSRAGVPSWGPELLARTHYARPTTSFSPPSAGCARSTYRSRATRPMPGRTSSAGGSTTRARLTRSPRRSTPFPRPGRDRAATARPRSVPAGRPWAASARGKFEYMICH